MRPPTPSVLPPATISRPEMLSDGTDGEFRVLVHRLLAFASRLQAIRAGLGQLIGLSAIQYTILICISHLQDEDGVGVKEIADHLSYSGAFVTMETGKLAARDLVERRRNPHDRRRVLLTVTDHGRALLNQLAPAQREVNDTLFAAMGRDDFERLLDISGYLVDSADEALTLLDFLSAPTRRSQAR